MGLFWLFFVCRRRVIVGVKKGPFCLTLAMDRSQLRRWQRSFWSIRSSEGSDSQPGSSSEDERLFIGQTHEDRQWSLRGNGLECQLNASSERKRAQTQGTP